MISSDDSEQEIPGFPLADETPEETLFSRVSKSLGVDRSKLTAALTREDPPRTDALQAPEIRAMLERVEDEETRVRLETALNRLDRLRRDES